MPLSEMFRAVTDDFAPISGLTFERSWFGKDDKLFPESAFQDSYNLLELHYNFISVQSPEVREKYIQFAEKVIDNYPKEESLYILLGLMLATVAHQYNLVRDKRYRKENDPMTKKPVPYIFHCMEMAERLIDEADYTKTPFAWWIVTAALLHDVPEDVNLGDGFNTKEDWFHIIEESFSDTSKGEAIAKVVRAVTNPERPKEYRKWAEIKRKIEENPLYQTIKAYIEKGGLKGQRSAGSTPSHITDSDLEKLYDVVYAFEHTMDEALSWEESLAALFIKIVDGWHNFQSPEHIREVKILRGRMFAVLSEWLGWYSMRDELIFQTAGVTDTNTPYLPEARGKSRYPPRATDRNTAHLLPLAKSVIQSLPKNYENFLFLKDLNLSDLRMFIGYPYITSDHKLPNLAYKASRLTLPLPEVIVFLNSSQMQELVALKELDLHRFIVSPPKDKSQIATLSPLGLGIESSMTIFGRKRVDYRLEIDNKIVFILRFEDGSLPYILEAFKQSSGTLIENAPEYALFHNDLYETDYWRFHRNALLGFLYDPNLCIQAGSEVYPVFYNGKLYFLPGELKIEKLRKLLSMPESVKYFETSRSEIPVSIPLNNYDLCLHELSEGSGKRKTFESRLLVFKDP